MADLQFIEQKIKIPGLDRTWRFLHLTDAHLVLCDERDTQRRREHAAARVPVFTQNGIPSLERFQAAEEWIRDNQDKIDGVWFTGDMLDFPSAANLDYFDKALTALPVPWVYTLGNHDWGHIDDYHTPHGIVADRPRFTGWCGGNTFIHKVHFGPLAVIGLDDTLDLYEDGVAETLAELLAGEKDVILLQHIPLYAETLHEDTVARWRSDLNIGGDKGICRNSNWQKILALITAETSPVRAVVTGHLHLRHLDLLAGKIPQYVTPPAAFGHGTIFTLESI